jgi:ABC-type siderophore export system fused ATPase/permease subunit
MKHLTIVPLKKHFAMSKETEDFFKEEIKHINPEKKPLTIETLRSFSGFENVTDEEANEIIFSVQQFAELFHEFYMELERMKERGEIKDIIAYLLDEEKLSEQNTQEELIQKQAA